MAASGSETAKMTHPAGKIQNFVRFWESQRAKVKGVFYGFIITVEYFRVSSLNA